MKTTFLLLIFLSVNSVGKIHAHTPYKKEQLGDYVTLDTSKIIFLQFTLRILPDNGWILYLFTDSTYLYKHINMFGDSQSLETGTFTLKKEKLTLHPVKKDPNFKNRKYQLIEESSNKSMNTRNFGCDEINDKTYCLYMK